MMAQLIRQHHIDIIHTNTAAVWTGGFIAKIFRKKHIWQVMEILESPRLVSWTTSKMVGLFSSKVFTISAAVREHFLRDNPGKQDLFQVLYHGVDLEEYNWRRHQGETIRNRLRLASDAIVVGMAGRINHWKGQDVLLDAVPHVLYSLHNCRVHFLILGSCFNGQENYEVALKEKIKALSLQNQVTLVGFQKNFADWLAAMDVFVLPSKLPEPNATVTIAAMAMKLPVIGTNTGGTRETIVDGVTGFLVPPADPQALAEKIVTLCLSRKTRRHMGENGYLRICKYFSVKNYAQTVMEAYSS